jgi:hypothetical protein
MPLRSHTIPSSRLEVDGGSTKHRVQQSGKGQTISGAAPPQSDHRSSSIPVPSSRSAHTESGIVPVNEFPCNKNSFSWSRLPSGIDGIVPSSKLFSRNRSRSIGGFEYVAGRFPVRVLLDRYKFTMVDKPKTDAGMGPVNALLLKSMNSRRLKSPKTSGMLPVSLVDLWSFKRRNSGDKRKEC